MRGSDSGTRNSFSSTQTTYTDQALLTMEDYFWKLPNVYLKSLIMGLISSLPDSYKV